MTTFRDAELDDDVFVSTVNPLPVADQITQVQSFTESTANVAASATLSGAARDTGFARKRAVAYGLSSAAGTLNIEQSTDGTTWWRTHTLAMTANTAAVIDAPVVGRYVRAQYVNSATATTSFRLMLALHR